MSLCGVTITPCASVLSLALFRRVGFGHLARKSSVRTVCEWVSRRTERHFLASPTSVQYVPVKLDRILDIFGDDGEEKEGEADGWVPAQDAEQRRAAS